MHSAHDTYRGCRAISPLVQLVLGDDSDTVLREKNAESLGPASAAGVLTAALEALGTLGEKNAENFALTTVAWNSVLLEMQWRQTYC
jgi:hypothetical protein